MIDKILKKIEKKGDAGEVFMTSAMSYTGFIDTNELDMIIKSTEEGYSIRIFKDKKVGFAFSSNFSDAAINNTITNAIKTSKVNRECKDFSFPYSKERGEESFDRRIAYIEVNEIKDIAKNFLKKVTDVRMFVPISKFKFTTVKYALTNSSGLNIEGKGTFFFIEPYVIAKDGNKRSEAIAPTIFRFYNHDDVEKITDECISIAKATLNAKPAKTGSYDVILTPGELLALFHGTVGEMVLGSSKFFGWSIFKNMENKKVFDERITVEDDISLNGGSAAFSTDQEGVYRKKKIIFENGIFKGFLYDSFYGALCGEKTTGNGRRIADDAESWYAASPMNELNNLIFSKGDSDLDEMISETKKGIYVIRSAWPLADPFSGTFSIEIRNGFYIENGELKNPVKFTTVAGNMYEMLQKKIISISKERKLVSSRNTPFSVGGLVPIMKFENLSVASGVGVRK